MIGWLKYRGSNTWHRVEVLSRIPGTHHYRVRRSRTDFDVGPSDVLVVVGV